MKGGEADEVRGGALWHQTVARRSPVEQCQIKPPHDPYTPSAPQHSDMMPADTGWSPITQNTVIEHQCSFESENEK